MSELDGSSTLEPVDDTTVLKFLAKRPDFFQQHPGAVAGLSITHESGAAVSLVERQMLSLREGNRRMRAQVDDMIAAARQNQTLSEGVHTLARAMLSCRDVDPMIAAAQSELLRTARADAVIVVLMDEQTCAQAPGSALRRVAARDACWNAFRGLLDERLIRCGLATEDQLSFLFGDAAATVGSSAIAPLYTDDVVHGLLAMASADEATYTRDQGHLFLQQVADLISAGITRERV